jgi:sec-independent protein translocase protein TatC
MPKVLRPIGHEERLSVVDHLDELRSRLFVSLAVLLVAFGVCFWQNHRLLHVLDRALPHVSTVGQHGLAAVRSETVRERRGLLESAGALRALAISGGMSTGAQHALAQAAQGLTAAADSLPKNASNQEKPITIGVGESFTTTLTVAAYFALLVSLPLLIYEGYAFVIPALNPQERNVAKPLMAIAPILFILGVAFAYAVIMPPAVRFLQGYNNQEFDVLVQAKQYYTFEILTMLGVGLAFQMPLGLLGLHRLGVVDGSTLTRHWRYAVVIIAVIAAALPGADPVTTGLEALPLVVLLLASIVMLKIADRRRAAREAAEAAEAEKSAETFGGGLDMT